MRLRDIRKPLVASAAAVLLGAVSLPVVAHASSTAGGAKNPVVQRWVTTPAISFLGGHGTATQTFRYDAATNTTTDTFSITMNKLPAGTYQVWTCAAVTGSGGGCGNEPDLTVVKGHSASLTSSFSYVGSPIAFSSESTYLIQNSTNVSASFAMTQSH
jgi:hypothetical protein